MIYRAALLAFALLLSASALPTGGFCQRPETTEPPILPETDPDKLDVESLPNCESEGLQVGFPELNQAEVTGQFWVCGNGECLCDVQAPHGTRPVRRPGDPAIEVPCRPDRCTTEQKHKVVVHECQVDELTKDCTSRERTIDAPVDCGAAENESCGARTVKIITDDPASCRLCKVALAERVYPKLLPDPGGPVQSFPRADQARMDEAASLIAVPYGSPVVPKVVTKYYPACRSKQKITEEPFDCSRLAKGRDGWIRDVDLCRTDFSQTPPKPCVGECTWKFLDAQKKCSDTTIIGRCIHLFDGAPQ